MKKWQWERYIWVFVKGRLPGWGGLAVTLSVELDDSVVKTSAQHGAPCAVPVFLGNSHGSSVAWGLHHGGYTHRSERPGRES